MHKRTVKVVSVLLGLPLLLAGGWFLYTEFLRSAGVPGEVLAAEQALALPDTALLVSVDVAGLTSLTGAPAPGAEPALAAQVMADLGLEGVDLGRDVTRAVAALYPSAERWRGALVLFGSFAPEQVGGALRASGAFAVQEVNRGGEVVLLVTRRDPEICRSEPDWGLHLRADRLLLAEPSVFDTVLRRLSGQAPSGRPLDRFADLRGEDLMAAALFSPETLALPGPEPLVRGLLAAAHRLEGVSEAYLALGARALGRELRVDLELVPRAAGGGAVLARHWKGGEAPALAEWKQVAPSMAELFASLSVATTPIALRLQGTLDSEWLARAPLLPSELMILASRNVPRLEPGKSAPAEPPETDDESIELAGAASGSAASTDRLDLDAPTFRTKYPVSRLPHYNPRDPLAGSVDVVAGPFGIRMSRLSRGADPEVGLELELRAAAPQLQNLPRGRGPLLRVTQVNDEGGRDLLRDEPCGPERNHAAAELLGGYGSDLIETTKSVRLRPDVRLEQVAQIVGEIELTLPVSVEAVVIEQPAVGATVEGAGASVELTGVWDSGFSYRIRGDTARVLHVAALNRQSQPLASPQAWSGDLLGVPGRMGVVGFSGELGSVQVVFSLSDHPVRYAFELADAVPGSEGEDFATESVEFIEYTPEQFFREFKKRFGLAFKPQAKPYALATAGPFTLTLDEMAQLEGLEPRISVLAPDIPNMSYNLTGLELVLESVSLRGGKQALRADHATPEAPWKYMITPRHRFGRQELSVSLPVPTHIEAEPGDAQSLSGELRLRLPQDVYSVALPSVEPGTTITSGGVVVTVRELARDRFSLSVEGEAERVVGVQTFNADDRELFIERGVVERTPEGSVMTLNVHGRPARINVQVAREINRFTYPFRLQIERALPAAAEDQVD